MALNYGNPMVIATNRTGGKHVQYICRTHLCWHGDPGRIRVKPMNKFIIRCWAREWIEIIWNHKNKAPLVHAGYPLARIEERDHSIPDWVFSASGTLEYVQNATMNNEWVESNLLAASRDVVRARLDLQLYRALVIYNCLVVANSGLRDRLRWRCRGYRNLEAERRVPTRFGPRALNHGTSLKADLPPESLVNVCFKNQPGHSTSIAKNRKLSPHSQKVTFA